MSQQPQYAQYSTNLTTFEMVFVPFCFWSVKRSHCHTVHYVCVRYCMCMCVCVWLGSRSEFAWNRWNSTFPCDVSHIHIINTRCASLTIQSQLIRPPTQFSFSPSVSHSFASPMNKEEMCARRTQCNVKVNESIEINWTMADRDEPLWSSFLHKSSNISHKFRFPWLQRPSGWNMRIEPTNNLN